jgi:lysyl-tRNA synthetase class 2
MLEFYQSYATYDDLMVLTEELFVTVAKELFGSTKITSDNQVIDLQPPWKRLSLTEAVEEYGNLKREEITTIEGLRTFAQKNALGVDKELPYGNLLVEVFETVAEHNLIQPTFVTGYPLEGLSFILVVGNWPMPFLN